MGDGWRLMENGWRTERERKTVGEWRFKVDRKREIDSDRELNTIQINTIQIRILL